MGSEIESVELKDTRTGEWGFTIVSNPKTKLNAKKLNINTLAGGGDTVSAIKNTHAEDGFDYISNAGGAFLEWLEGNESPGVIALKENNFS